MKTTAQAGQYPKYIAVIWEGRLEAPAEYRAVPAIRRMFENGTIGGKKSHEVSSSSVKDLLDTLAREGINPRFDDVLFYKIPAVGQSRLPISFHRLLGET